MRITSRYVKAQAAGNIPTPGPTATGCAHCVAGSGRRRAGLQAAGVGGKPNAASTTPNAGPKDLRDNAHHHVSRELVRKYHTMGIETLNVAGMIKAGLQSRALADAGMSSLLDQIQYKAQLVRYSDRGGRPVVSQQQDLLRLRCGEREISAVHGNGNGTVPIAASATTATRMQLAICGNLRYSR